LDKRPTDLAEFEEKQQTQLSKTWQTGDLVWKIERKNSNDRRYPSTLFSKN